MKGNKYFKYIYECSPTDFFEPFLTFVQYLWELDKGHRVALVEGKQDDIINTTFEEKQRALRLLSEACYLAAKNTYWEGDIVAGPFVIGLPTSGPDPEIALVFKQENNGTTYIISPVELSYLKEWEESGKK